MVDYGICRGCPYLDCDEDGHFCTFDSDKDSTMKITHSCPNGYNDY